MGRLEEFCSYVQNVIANRGLLNPSHKKEMNLSTTKNCSSQLGKYQSLPGAVGARTCRCFPIRSFLSSFQRLYNASFLTIFDVL